VAYGQGRVLAPPAKVKQKDLPFPRGDGRDPRGSQATRGDRRGRPAPPHAPQYGERPPTPVLGRTSGGRALRPFGCSAEVAALIVIQEIV